MVALLRQQVLLPAVLLRPLVLLRMGGREPLLPWTGQSPVPAARPQSGAPGPGGKHAPLLLLLALWPLLLRLPHPPPVLRLPAAA